MEMGPTCLYSQPLPTYSTFSLLPNHLYSQHITFFTFLLNSHAKQKCAYYHGTEGVCYVMQMIHFMSMALGGEGYLNFMGNEFGHPEWIDFPREGNGWSHERCKRQWELVEAENLRYKFMNKFDRAMNILDEKFSFLASTKQIVSSKNEHDKVIVFERGELVFVFNFHQANTYDGYKVGCHLPGKYRVALDSDALEFGGHGRVDQGMDHFTTPEGIPGFPKSYFNNQPNSFKILLPPRTCVVFYRVEESSEESDIEVTSVSVDESFGDDNEEFEAQTHVIQSNSNFLAEPIEENTSSDIFPHSQTSKN